MRKIKMLMWMVLVSSMGIFSAHALDKYNDPYEKEILQLKIRQADLLGPMSIGGSYGRHAEEKHDSLQKEIDELIKCQSQAKQAKSKK